METQWLVNAAKIMQLVDEGNAVNLDNLLYAASIDDLFLIRMLLENASKAVRGELVRRLGDRQGD